MRNLLIAGLSVVSLAGVVYAQGERPNQAQVERQLREMLKPQIDRINALPKTCVDAAGATRNLKETTSIGPLEFRCVRTFGDGLIAKGADWVLVTPLPTRVNVSVF